MIHFTCLFGMWDAWLPHLHRAKVKVEPGAKASNPHKSAPKWAFNFANLLPLLKPYQFNEDYGTFNASVAPAFNLRFISKSNLSYDQIFLN